MFKILICSCLIACCATCGSPPPPVDRPEERPFQTGWWTDAERLERLATYAADGDTLVLANGPGWFTSPGERPKIKAFLDEAQKYDIKVIVSMVRERHTPYGIPVQEFVDTIAAYKSHPALHAWLIGDEPELYNAGDGYRADDWIITHGYLADDPDYYHLAKAADPSHPTLISFNQLYNPLDTYYAKVANFLDVTDLIGMHNYPFYSTGGEFDSGDSRTQYDKWKYMLEKTALNNKAGFIATAQGFGVNPHSSDFRDPTLAELRYQTFCAVVLGVDKILFWYDGWASSFMKSLVGQMIGQIQDVGAAMEAGTTNDSRIGVSVTDRDQIVYRYGVSGNTGVLLAVNIANRTKVGGATLSNVRFTLPAGTSATQVTVLHENRNLPVTGGTFTDDFAPFAVHAYSFTVPGAFQDGDRPKGGQ